ncbi:hypothetical protein Hanom_Chr01g00002551 [Helianthus anomalus]
MKCVCVCAGGGGGDMNYIAIWRIMVRVCHWLRLNRWCDGCVRLQKKTNPIFFLVCMILYF